jgi:uncharacterized protein YbaR (Trm112 family)
MPIKKELLEILVCPLCKNKVKTVGSDKLICTNDECGTIYPIEDGIPNMLPPDLR